MLESLAAWVHQMPWLYASVIVAAMAIEGLLLAWLLERVTATRPRRRHSRSR